MLGLGPNDALASIERDFTKAKEWLQANDKNLRSIWTALQAADKLRDLDDRLTKAFASKMSVAIFSALQDTRAGVARIETTLEGLPTNLESVCKTSTKEAIHEAIGELKAEAYAVSGNAEGQRKGFRNGEAEKIISQVSSWPRSRPCTLAIFPDFGLCTSLSTNSQSKNGSKKTRSSCSYRPFRRSNRRPRLRCRTRSPLRNPHTLKLRYPLLFLVILPTLSSPRPLAPARDSVGAGPTPP